MMPPPNTWKQSLSFSRLFLVLTILLFSIPMTEATEDLLLGTTKGRWVQVEITAYCPCEICCAGTADGKTAFMVDTKKVPYNLAGDLLNFYKFQRVSIPLGYGVLDRIRSTDRDFIVDDRGGALNYESRKYRIPRLDLRVKDHNWAVQFGRKRIVVFIYD